jgi:Reverse transcriptase (RNA-dependent DNA polymerase)
MRQYGTWTIVRLPNDVNVVDTKCVLYIKNPGTKEERYNARIITRGSSMKLEEDYFDTHASVVKSTTIRILLSLAAALGMIVELANVETVYLNAALHEFIHAEQPPSLSSRTVRNMDFHNLDSNGQQRSAPLLKSLDSAALLMTTTLMSTIPTIPTNVQQQSSSLYTLTISSLPPKINRQSTQQSTTSTRPSTFAV